MIKLKVAPNDFLEVNWGKCTSSTSASCLSKMLQLESDKMLQFFLPRAPGSYQFITSQRSKRSYVGQGQQYFIFFVELVAPIICKPVSCKSENIT